MGSPSTRAMLLYSAISNSFHLPIIAQPSTIRAELVATTAITAADSHSHPVFVNIALF